MHSASIGDMAVLLQAVEATTPVAAGSVPRYGNFYSAAHILDGWPPLPGSMGLDAWDLGNGCFLLDDLNVSDTSGGLGMRAMSMSLESASTLESGYEEPAYDTNGLFLEIVSVSNGAAWFNLHGATDSVYEVWSKTDLLAPSWNIEQEVWPDTNQTVTSFTVPVLDRTNLFIWARDWTGITSNGNETPDWWFWKYFGMVDLSDTNLDSIGQQLMIDYQYGVDPNIIFFSLQFSNEVHASIVNGNAAILGGTPFYEAVLVNDTNNADAIWQPYTGSNIVVSLNSGEGVYTVRVGLRGLPDDTQPTWQQTELTYSAPVALTMAITEPASTTVSTPLIQLQGLVNETLSALTYDVSNAVGVITNQPGYWQAEFYDTNFSRFTTNSFQCYDIPLTNGLNTVTLHAADLAGNTATTNFSVTLDYSTDTTPPVLNLIWPQDGTAIGGGNFSVQAQVDDATATIMASMDGGTNIVQGLVERSGTVWFNNLPLADGTNTLSITATDAAGNVSTTNITLIKAVVSVTMDPLPDDQLNQNIVSVTGTISDPSYTLTVNGTNAYYIDDAGDWEADNVPASPTGTAVFDVEIYLGDP
ncbi:MAG: Ig-like domain-containing protein [Limisphaerales bacterium]